MAEDNRVHTLAMNSRILSNEQIAELENRVSNTPSDVESRIKLLGYYTGQQYSSSKAGQARIPHIIWFVDNRPDHAICGLPYTSVSGQSEEYASVKARWLLQLELRKSKIAVLLNAAHFFFTA